MTYYAQRKTIIGGEPQTINNRFGDRDGMERQFHLYIANILDPNNERADKESVEWGTVEGGAIERKLYTKPEPQPEPEPETEAVGESV